MKDKKDRSKYWFIVLGVFFGIIVMLALQPQPKTATGNSEWEKAFNSSEPKIIFMGRPTCGWCNKFRPGLDNLSEQYNIQYVYVNTDSTTEEELNRIFSALGIDPTKFGTPYTVVVKNGKKIAEQPGYISEAPLFDFLQDNGFIPKDAVYTPNDKTPKEE